MVNGEAAGLESHDEGEETLYGFNHGGGIEHLRADVTGHACDRQIGLAGGVCVGLLDDAHVDAELVFLEAGGDVFVGDGVDVGVDSECDAGGFSRFARDAVEDFDLGVAFAVETVDALLDGVADFISGFADSAEDYV